MVSAHAACSAFAPPLPPPASRRRMDGAAFELAAQAKRDAPSTKSGDALRAYKSHGVIGLRGTDAEQRVQDIRSRRCGCGRVFAAGSPEAGELASQPLQPRALACAYR